MPPRLRIYAALYLGLLALVVAGCGYAAAWLGRPWRYGAMAGFVLVWFANGTFAYVYRARRLRAEGKQPPTYATYMLYPARGPVPRSLRVVVGLGAMGSGAGFRFIFGKDNETLFRTAATREDA